MPTDKSLERAVSLVMEQGAKPEIAARACRVELSVLFTRLRELKKDVDEVIKALPPFGTIPKQLLDEQGFYQRKVDREASEFLRQNGFTTIGTKRKG